MVRSRTLLAVVAAVAVPVAATVATAGPAAARKLVPTGSVTCAFGETITFSPALVPSVAGSPAPYDKITISPANLSGCTGTTKPSGEVPQVGAGTKPVVLKWKGSKFDGTLYSGSCQQFATFVWPKLKTKYNWTLANVHLKGSKVSGLIEEGALGPGGVLAFDFTNGVATGSFAGMVSVDANLTPASSDALEACKANGPPVPSLVVDPTTSTITVG